MYYCRDCGAVTEGHEEHECVLPEVVGEQPPCYMDYVTCSGCGSDNVEEAVQCPICGEWHEEITWSKLCSDCLHEIFSDFYDTFTNFKETYPDAKPRDILEGMADEFEKFYDEMFILIGKRQEEKNGKRNCKETKEHSTGSAAEDHGYAEGVGSCPAG